MNSTGVKFDVLTKENYDTWRIQMRAVLIKNNAWGYASGTITKPEIVAGDDATKEASDKWTELDLKAQSDIVLAVNPSELKQIKNCQSASEIWTKLGNIYQSKGPARKASLLNSLMSMKMNEGDDAHDHSRSFFDIVDKLGELEVEINKDLLAVMFLRSLPESFDNFRCAMSSRDELPSLEVLRIKVLEEFDARKTINESSVQNAMIAKKTGSGQFNYQNRHSKPENGSATKNDSKMKCFKCGEIGHRARFCPKNARKSKDQTASNAESECFFTTFDTSKSETFKVGDSLNSDYWCLDSGTTSHMCKDINDFAEINRDGNQGRVNLASSMSTNILGKGIVSTNVEMDGKCKEINFKDTLYVPDLRTNLISVGKITSKGHKVIFSNTKAEVVDCAGKVLLIANREKDLYYVRKSVNPECKNVAESDIKIEVPKKNSLEDWHIKMGHLNIQSLKSAIKSKSIQGINVESFKDFECSVCIMGKMCRLPFPKASEKVTVLGEIIHSDICGPMRVTSHGKNRFFVTFIDDSSRWCEVKFIAHKNQALEEFKNFRALVETQHGKKIQCLQSDNGKEYENKNFNSLLEQHGILRRLTAPYNPQQNGVSERRNRTLMETARCLLIQSGLPSVFWAEAVNTANYIRNRSPSTKLNGKTPFEAWYGKAPDVTDFKRFGCDVFVMNRKPGRSKLEPKSRKGIFVGYSQESKAYRIWIPEEKKIEVSRDVKFLEKSEIQIIKSYEDFGPIESQSESSSSLRDIGQAAYDDFVDIDLLRNEGSNDLPDENIQDASDDYTDESDGEDLHGFPPNNPQPARTRGRPKLVRTGQRGRPKKVYATASNATYEGTDCTFLAEIPISKALSSQESNEWMQAMGEEVRSILGKNTWDLVDRPAASTVIGSRFILTNKYGKDGVLDRRKARIVAKGYSQQHGENFTETFAPVARLGSIRTTIAFAVRENMHIQQYDVTTAYLNGKLDETVYMEVPKRFEEVLRFIVNESRDQDPSIEKAKAMLDNLTQGNKVCLMRKALYGLKQAGRAWHNFLDEKLRKLGAEPTNSDQCVYLIKGCESIIIIVVYVDDILVMCKDRKKISWFGRQLGKFVEVQDIGDLKRCLGIDFSRTDNGIVMNQRTYITEILERFGMKDCNSLTIPLDVGTKLMKCDSWSEDDGEKPPYRELIGCLLYLSVATRPDIAHAASSLSQFNDCFGKNHWIAAKRVLRYLQATKDYGITYHSNGDSLIGYVDADWGGSIDDRRSFTGYAFMMSGGIITWDSKKQRTVALSTTEAEYMALSEAAKEATHLRRFLRELGSFDVDSVKLCVDNLSAQKLATNPVYHARSKHIDIRHHFVREAVKSGQLCLEHISSEDMPADVLTKALTKPKHERCIYLLGMSKI